MKPKTIFSPYDSNSVDLLLDLALSQMKLLQGVGFDLRYSFLIVKMAKNGAHKNKEKDTKQKRNQTVFEAVSVQRQIPGGGLIFLASIFVSLKKHRVHVLSCFVIV